MKVKKTKTPLFLAILLLGCTFLITSCGDIADNNPLSPEEVGLTADLGNNDGTKPLYVYGARDIDFSVSADKGEVELIQILYQGIELQSFTDRTGRFHFTPDISKEGTTDLEMKITMTVEQNIYQETINYKVQYVKISEEDFELKDATIDRFVFKMKAAKLENYKYILGGKIIDDLDNIVVERKHLQFSFPTEASISIILVPKEHEYSSNQTYPQVKLDISDKKMGDFHIGSTLSHYIDAAHKELYVWSLGELSVFDKDMKEIKHLPKEDIDNVFVTPNTGLVVVQPLFGSIVTYSDKNMNATISTIQPQLRTGILHVSERDHLFNGHNFMIDVYNLHTGEILYTLQFDDSVSDFTISGDKLLVKLGNNGRNQVYQLNERLAMLLYSFQNDYANCIAHPVNRNHIILDRTYNGFEVFDLEARTSVLSIKGQFQSIDPISGSLLYYDEKYGVANMYNNHVADLNYNKIFVFEDASQSTNGAFVQFNNYIIKSDRYTNLLPQK